MRFNRDPVQDTEFLDRPNDRAMDLMVPISNVYSCKTEIQNGQVILTQPEQALNTTLRDTSTNLRRQIDARERRKWQHRGKTTLLLFKPQLQECFFNT